MGTVRVLTAERTLEIGAATVVNAAIVNGDLIFYKQNGAEINLGPIAGPAGAIGPEGPAGGDGPAGPAGPAANPVENVSDVAASGAAQTIPAVTVATLSRITLTANCTFTFPSVAAGKSFLLALKQDATGSRTATWPSTVRWAAGSAPNLTAGATKRDLFSFICIDGSTWLGMVVGQNFSP